MLLQSDALNEGILKMTMSFLLKGNGEFFLSFHFRFVLQCCITKKRGQRYKPKERDILGCYLLCIVHGRFSDYQAVNKKERGAVQTPAYHAKS